MCLVIAGCSSANDSGQSQSNAVESASSSSPSTVEDSSRSSKVTEAASASDDTKAAFIGTWDMTMMTDGSTTYGEGDLQRARQSGTDSYLTIEDNGTGMLVVGEKQLSFTWKTVNDNTIKTTANNGGTDTLTLNNGILSVTNPAGKNIMTFKKGEARMSAENASGSSEPVANNSVSPDLKETMDSYEAFMDEYIDFMKRYQESDDTTSLLQDYTNYMAKYSDFMQKVNKLDTSKMSAADSAYYLEVTTRVSKKLLEASL